MPVTGNEAPPSHGGGGSGDRPYIGTNPNVPLAGLPFDLYKSKAAPKGHRYQGFGGLTPVTRRYREGDDWALLAGKDTQQIIDLQSALVQSGALKPGKFAVGQANDPATRKAFRNLLEGANAAGMDYGDYLNNAVQTAKSVGFDPFAASGASAPPAFTPVLTNPEQVKKDAASLAMQDLGSVAAAGNLDTLAKNYNAQELTAQKQQYDQTYGPGGPDANTGPGGVTIKPPDIETLIKMSNPGAYQVGTTLGPAAQRLMDVLTSNPGAGTGMQRG